jgi:hypothetical protein
LEESAVGSHILDLVVRNYGQTAGRNIRLSFEPRLNRTDDNGGTEDVILPDVISFWLRAKSGGRCSMSPLCEHTAKTCR